MVNQIIPRSVKVILLIALVLVCHTHYTDAALVAHEPFYYTAGSAIHNQSGGTFAGAWTDNVYWVPGYTASNGGLAYTGLASSGNAAFVSGNGSDYRLNRSIGRVWTTIPYTTGTDEMWISFLLQVDDNTPRADEYAGLVLGYPGAVGSVFIGMYDSRNIGFNVQEHGNFYNTIYVGENDDPLTVGQTHLLLAHIVFNGLAADTIDLWIDPDIRQPLGIPNDSYTNAWINISLVDFRAAYMDGGALIDEIRIGDTLADVTPAVDPPMIDDVSFDGCISELCESTLTATAYDPEGGTLSYTWTALDGGTIFGTGDTVDFDPPNASLPPACLSFRVQLAVTSDVSGLTTEQTLEITVKMAGDVDGDGTVNIVDKVLVRNAFGSTGDMDEDVNCDGVVNIVDKVIVRNQFGQSGCPCP